MECHKCKYNGKHDEHCLSCKMSDTQNNHGRVHISLDSVESDGDSVLEHRRGRVDKTPADELEEEEEAETGCVSGVTESFLKMQGDKIDCVRKVTYSIFQLETDEYDLVRNVLNYGYGGISFYAVKQGVTKQFISERLAKITARLPYIGEMLFDCIGEKAPKADNVAIGEVQRNAKHC